MELYKIPRGSFFKLSGGARDTEVPPGAPPVAEEQVYQLGNIDGMYSYCKDSFGQVVHIKAWAEVELVA